MSTKNPDFTESEPNVIVTALGARTTGEPVVFWRS